MQSVKKNLIVDIKDLIAGEKFLRAKIINLVTQRKKCVTGNYFGNAKQKKPVFIVKISKNRTCDSNQIEWRYGKRAFLNWLI